MDEDKIVKEIDESRIALMTELHNIKDKLDKQEFEFETFKKYVMEKLG